MASGSDKPKNPRETTRASLPHHGYRHAPPYVLVSFKPEASADQIAASRIAVDDICETSAEVLSFSQGMNIGSGPNHYDAAHVAVFEDTYAFRRYTGSEKHKAYVEDHARHTAAKLAAIQHEI